MAEPGLARRLLLNTASTGAGNLWAMVVGLVSLPLLLKGLGPSAFGTWILLQTFSAVNGWFSLADLGVGIATTRAIAERAALEDDAGRARVIGSALATFAVLGLVAGGVLMLAGPAWLPALFSTPTDLLKELRLAIVFFSAQVVFDVLTEGAEASLEGLQRVDLSRLADGVRRSLVAVAVVAAAFATGRLSSVAVASLAASAASTLVAAAILLATGRGRRAIGLPSFSGMLALVNYGGRVGVANAAGVLHRSMDRVIVGLFIGPAAVTLVEIATQIQNGAQAVMSSTAYAVVPAASWLKTRGDTALIRSLIERGTRYSLVATLPVAAVIAILAGPFISVWVGDRYSAAAGLAAVALLAVVILAPTVVAANYLQGAGRINAILLAVVAGVLTNLVVSVLLVHSVGVVGVFIGTAIGTLVQAVPVARIALLEVGLDVAAFLRRSVAGPLMLAILVAVACATTVFVVPSNQLLRLAAGVLVSMIVFIAVVLRDRAARNEARTLAALVTRRN